MQEPKNFASLAVIVSYIFILTQCTVIFLNIKSSSAAGAVPPDPRVLDPLATDGNPLSKILGTPLPCQKTVHCFGFKALSSIESITFSMAVDNIQ